jgi:hypothetical protein
MKKQLSMLAIGLLVAACTTAGATGSTAPDASTLLATPPAGGYDVATGADQLVLRIESGGGLVPISFILTHTPALALYGDGRIVVEGPVDSIFPTPLLPNLRQMQVTPAEIQKILAAADAAGLLGPNASFDATDIMDAGTTTFTTTVAGKTHTISAYALGYQGVIAEGSVEAVRTRLSSFEAQMMDLGAFLGRDVASVTYDANEMRVFSSVYDSSQAASPAPQVVAWPLTMDLATAGEVTNRPEARCMVLTGPDLAAFLTTARTANVITVWTYGSGRYSVMVRPLYPDETGCPGS